MGLMKRGKSKTETRCAGPEANGRCTRPVIAKSLCTGHYQQKKHGFNPLRILRIKWLGVVCKISNCDRPVLSKGLCSAHYQQHKAGKKFTHPRLVNLGPPRLCFGPSNKQEKACGQIVLAQGLCAGHYQQYRKKHPLRPLQIDFPPEIRAYRAFFRHYQYSAKKSGRKWALTFNQFMQIVNRPCHYCNSAPVKNVFSRRGGGGRMNGVDRRNNESYYRVENSLPCCTMHNMMKGVMREKEFIKACKVVTEAHI